MPNPLEDQQPPYNDVYKIPSDDSSPHNDPYVDRQQEPEPVDDYNM